MSGVTFLDPELAAPTRVDRASSQRLARAVGARDRGCYRNALRALPRLPDATYVEGVVAMQNGLRLEHAWLETIQGVVDPTPVYAAMREGTCTYFAGPRWTLGEIRALFSAEQDEIVTPILGYDLTDCPQRRAWITATLAAFRHVSALHVQQTGQPAIAPETHGAMLEAILGSYWAKRLREACDLPGRPVATELQHAHIVACDGQFAADSSRTTATNASLARAVPQGR